MTKNTTEKKYKDLLIALIIIITVFLIGTFIHCYWKSKIIDESSGYNSINSVISLLALIINIITIFFVYRAYKSQVMQIEIQKTEIIENKEETEYNRILDIIYKQLELNISTFTNEKSNFNKINEYIFHQNKSNILSNLPEISRLSRLINDEINFYISLINKANLEIHNKKFLFNIIYKNLGNDYIEFLMYIGQFESLILNCATYDNGVGDFKKEFFESYIDSNYEKYKRKTEYKNLSEDEFINQLKIDLHEKMNVKYLILRTIIKKSKDLSELIQELNQ
ncbi:hypothetical protein [Sphingobacterium faecium]